MADDDKEGPASTVEEEVVEYLFRRHEFVDHKFLPQWGALAAAGVKFANPQYIYKGRRFASAMALQQALDRYAVRSRVSIWDTEVNGEGNVADGDTAADPDMEQLRRVVCRLLYKMGKFHKPADADGGENSDDAGESTGRGNERSKPPSNAISSRRRGKTPESTTAALQSSDIYLRKNKKKRKVAAGTKVNSGTSESASLVFPTVRECGELMKHFDTSYAEEIEAQHEANDFDSWKMALATGYYHLLFYGHGSKYELLQSFCEGSLAECLTLQIQGWETKASVAAVLELLQIHCTAASVENEPIAPTILVIHSLDALMQREKDSKVALEVLVNTATKNNIRLACSVNHVDPPVLTERHGRRSFHYIPVHTHRPVELSETGDASTESRPAARQRRSADRMWAVLQNLAPRYAEVLQVLARLLLAENSNASWILYKDFLKASRDACLIDKDGKLRGLLQELKDHGLLTMRADAGADSVSIPFDHKTLRDIVKYEPRKGR